MIGPRFAALLATNEAMTRRKADAAGQDVETFLAAAEVQHQRFSDQSRAMFDREHQLAAIDHLAGRRCAADECQTCEEREVMERVAARESYLDGAADYAMDERKERAMEVRS